MKKAIILFSVIAAMSCGSETTQSTVDKTDSVTSKPAMVKLNKEDLLKNIAGLEEKAYQAQSINQDTAIMLVKIYTDFANSYPEDSARTASYLFKAANIARYTGETIKDKSKSRDYFNQSLVLLDQVQQYKSFNGLEEAFYMEAMIYDLNLRDIGKAKTKYEEFIQLFPKSEMASSAKAAIELLGKSDEQLIEEFTKKNK